MRGMIVAWGCVVIAGLIVFVDTPFLKLGQKFRVERRNERLVLMSIELNLFLPWAMGRYFFGLDRPLVPASAALGASGFGLIATGAGVTLAAAAKIRLGNLVQRDLRHQGRPPAGYRLALPLGVPSDPCGDRDLGRRLRAGDEQRAHAAVRASADRPVLVPHHVRRSAARAALREEFREYRDRVPGLVPSYGMRTTRAPRTPNGVSSRTR